MKTVNSDSECFNCSLHAVRGGVLHDNIKNGYVVFFFWMILVKKIGIFLYFHFWLKKDMKMFDDVPDRKQAFLDDKNIHLT